MSDTLELIAEKREITGKKVQSIRRGGFVPATVYEKGKESTNVQIAYVPMSKAYAAVGLGQPVSLVIDNKKYLTMTHRKTPLCTLRSMQLMLTKPLRHKFYLNWLDRLQLLPQAYLYDSIQTTSLSRVYRETCQSILK
jgi:ribosomal protein L25 (general stress protein Ctc)